MPLIYSGVVAMSGRHSLPSTARIDNTNPILIRVSFEIWEELDYLPLQGLSWFE